MQQPPFAVFAWLSAARRPGAGRGRARRHAGFLLIALAGACLSAAGAASLPPILRLDDAPPHGRAGASMERRVSLAPPAGDAPARAELGWRWIAGKASLGEGRLAIDVTPDVGGAATLALACPDVARRLDTILSLEARWEGAAETALCSETLRLYPAGSPADWAFAAGKTIAFVGDLGALAGPLRAGGARLARSATLSAAFEGARDLVIVGEDALESPLIARAFARQMDEGGAQAPVLVLRQRRGLPGESAATGQRLDNKSQARSCAAPRIVAPGHRAFFELDELDLRGAAPAGPPGALPQSGAFRRLSIPADAAVATRDEALIWEAGAGASRRVHCQLALTGGDALTPAGDWLARGLLRHLLNLPPATAPRRIVVWGDPESHRAQALAALLGCGEMEGAANAGGELDRLAPEGDVVVVDASAESAEWLAAGEGAHGRALADHATRGGWVFVVGLSPESGPALAPLLGEGADLSPWPPATAPEGGTAPTLAAADPADPADPAAPDSAALLWGTTPADWVVDPAALAPPARESPLGRRKAKPAEGAVYALTSPADADWATLVGPGLVVRRRMGSGKVVFCQFVPLHPEWRGRLTLGQLLCNSGAQLPEREKE